MPIVANSGTVRYPAILCVTPDKRRELQVRQTSSLEFVCSLRRGSHMRQRSSMAPQLLLTAEEPCSDNVRCCRGVRPCLKNAACPTVGNQKENELPCVRSRFAHPFKNNLVSALLSPLCTPHVRSPCTALSTTDFGNDLFYRLAHPQIMCARSLHTLF